MSDIHDRHPSEERLQAFLDGDVPARERRRLEKHVASCPRCSDELATWRHLFEDLDALSSHRPSVDFQARVMAGVRVPEDLPWAARAKARLAALVPAATTRHLPADVLQDVADGALGARAAARAMAHLEGCAVCEAELRSWTGVIDQLSALQQLAPPDGFADHVMGRWATTTSRVGAAKAPAVAARRRWTRAWAGAKRLLPRTRRAWAAVSGAAVTPAVVLGLVLWTVFSHPTLTPQALASFAFWQLSDLAVTAWSALVSGALGLARITNLDGLVATMLDAPFVTAFAFTAYAVAFLAAARILYKNLIDRRSPGHRYASASVS